MAVSTDNAFSGPYLTNGVTTVFPFTFTAPSADEVDVVLRNASGVDTVATGFTTTLLPGGVGGSVAFATPPAPGFQLFVLLEPEFTQNIAFENGSAWRAEPVNEGYDRSALRDQALKRDVDRGLKAPVGESGFTLPDAQNRAEKALFFAHDGTPDTISVDDFAAPARAAWLAAEGYATILHNYVLGFEYATPEDGVDPVTGVSSGRSFEVLSNGRIYGFLNDGGVPQGPRYEWATAAFFASVDGAGIGYLSTAAYPEGTLGYAVRQLGGAADYGTLTSGVNEFVDRQASMSVNPAGTARAADVKWTTRLNGTGDLTEIRPFELGGQYYFNGTAIFGYGLIGYTRVGLDGNYDANVTSLRGVEWHVANEGDGVIDTAQCFQAGDVDFRGNGFTTGTGTIRRLYGYRSNNLQGQGLDAGRVTLEAFGFVADDISEGAEQTAGFVSRLSNGENKWSYLSLQGAPSAFLGNFRVGDLARPTDVLEAHGYAKLASDGLKQATGGYHESSQHQSDFIHFFRNRHATAPNGIVVAFADAVPNDTGHTFLICRDNAADRLRVYANGSVVNVTNSYGAISDATLKTDIVDAGPQLADIVQLKVRKFRFLADGPEAPVQIGLIAQEVEAVSPGLVSEDRDGIKSVAYSVLNIKLLKAVQELAAKVDELSARIAELESN